MNWESEFWNRNKNATKIVWKCSRFTKICLSKVNNYLAGWPAEWWLNTCVKKKSKIENIVNKKSKFVKWMTKIFFIALISGFFLIIRIYSINQYHCVVHVLKKKIKLPMNDVLNICTENQRNPVNRVENFKCSITKFWNSTAFESFHHSILFSNSLQ